jgi:hypothetical protein
MYNFALCRFTRVSSARNVSGYISSLPAPTALNLIIRSQGSGSIDLRAGLLAMQSRTFMNETCGPIRYPHTRTSADTRIGASIRNFGGLDEPVSEPVDNQRDSEAMKNGERRWVELCAQAGAAKDPEERERILQELADLLEQMQRYMRQQPKEKEP